MQTDLEHCRKKELGNLAEVECCFHIAERYWAMLRAEVSEYAFESRKEEIKFFKVTKPAFTAEVEYYGLRYHAELFRQDVNDTVDLRNFWTREKRRLTKFIQENAGFYQYYKEGKDQWDERYFIRQPTECSDSPRAKVYDLEEKATTSHDPLVSMILALERYMDFVKAELGKLPH